MATRPDTGDAQDIERLKADIDLRLKEAELAIKKVELEAKAREQRRPSLAYLPLMIAVTTGILGLIGAGVAAFLQARANLDLEHEKLQSSLILKAIETGSSEASRNNLIFLVGVGLLKDPSGRIAALTPQDAPVLPSPAGIPVPTTDTSRKAFFDGLRVELEGGTLTQGQIDALTRLFDFIRNDQRIRDLRYVAYILATIKYETNNRYAPATELGSDALLEKLYGYDTTLGQRLGNTAPGDAVKYKGRGYIVIAGKNNYKLIGDKLGIDLAAVPEMVLEPEIAYQILSTSMIDGSFTGKKLSDFINDEQTDYVGARKIVAGPDRAELIAAYATKFESILRASLASNPSSMN